MLWSAQGSLAVLSSLVENGICTVAEGLVDLLWRVAEDLRYLDACSVWFLPDSTGLGGPIGVLGLRICETSMHVQYGFCPAAHRALWTYWRAWLEDLQCLYCTLGTVPQ